MKNISDKSADNQSEARISLAINKNCHVLLMISFVKQGPGVEKENDRIKKWLEEGGVNCELVQLTEKAGDGELWNSMIASLWIWHVE